METLKLFLITGFFVNPSEPVSSDLVLLADVITIFVGIFGIISVVIVGIKYLTAPSNSPKIKRSKRHLFEIILGLVVYAIVYAIVRWLLLIFEV